MTITRHEYYHSQNMTHTALIDLSMTKPETGLSHDCNLHTLTTFVVKALSCQKIYQHDAEDLCDYKLVTRGWGWGREEGVKEGGGRGGI